MMKRFIALLGLAAFIAGSTVQVTPQSGGIVSQAHAINLAVSAGGPKYFTSGSTGGFTPGSPSVFSDDYNYTVGRLTSGSTKNTTFQAHGYDGLKDGTTHTMSQAGGYLWTSDRAGIIAQFGVDPGVTPGGLSKFLVIEGLASQGTDLGGGTAFQSDYYLALPTWPTHVSWQYVTQLVNNGGIPYTSNKRWYAAYEVLGGTPNSSYLILEGRKFDEESNGFLSSGQRSAYFNDTYPNPLNKILTDLTSTGISGQGVYGVLDNTNTVGGGTQRMARMNLSPYLVNRDAGTWYLIRMQVDISGANAIYRRWQAPFNPSTGRLASSLTLVQEVIGGTTSGYTWSYPSSATVNGTTFNPRTANCIMKFPTVQDYRTSGNIGDYTELMGNLEITAGDPSTLGSYLYLYLLAFIRRTRAANDDTFEQREAA